MFNRKNYLTVFFLGFLLIGSFDLLNTYLGGQSYMNSYSSVAGVAWPLHVPVQMGLAGVLIMFTWRRIAPCLQLKQELVTGDAGLPFLVTTAVAIVILSLGPGADIHTSLFTAGLLASFLFLVLAGTRLDTAAFAIVGIAGGTAEWFLLDPDVGYWKFADQTLFGRLPMWEPVLYGWIGVTVHRLSMRV